MDGAFDIPDSTDWLNTPLSDFSTLENALHCQICKEFYDTPMITSCAHTFCSKCIRTSLSTDGKCPACRASDQASKLRNNWALQEVVATFLNARSAAIELARKKPDESAQSKKPGKRKRAVLDSDDMEEVESHGPNTRRKSQRIAASQTSQTEPVEIDDSDGDDDFEPAQVVDDGLVECPLGCGKRMKIEAVEPHLDRCEDEKKQESRPKSRTPVNAFAHTLPPSSQNTKPEDRISELNSSLFNEAKLSKKLREMGLPNTGSKQLMMKRHTEWVNLHNANCDSNSPRTRRELLRDLDTWERTQGGKAPIANGLSSTIMRKDFDGTGWVNRNKDDFSRLIAEARRKKHNPALEEDRPKGVEVVDFAMKYATNSDERTDAVASVLEGNDVVASTEPSEVDVDAIHLPKPGISDTKTSQQDVDQVASPEPLLGGETLQPFVYNPNEERRLSDALPKSDSEALLEKNNFGSSQANGVVHGHTAYTESSTSCDLPAHLQSSPIKKVPMFSMPQLPVTDVDGGGSGSGGG